MTLELTETADPFDTRATLIVTGLVVAHEGEERAIDDLEFIDVWVGGYLG